MLVGSVTSLDKFHEFVNDRIEDDFKLDDTGIGLGSNYSRGYGQYDLGVVGLAGDLQGRYHPVGDLTLGYAVGGSVSTGEALKYPAGTEQRLEISENNQVQKLPVLGTLVDKGIWAGLTRDEEHARVDADFQVTKRFSVGASAKAQAFALTTTEAPAIEWDVEGRSRLRVGQEAAIETNIQRPVIDPLFYKPTICNVGLQAGPNLFVGGHVAVRDNAGMPGSPQLDSVGGVAALMPGSRLWNVNAAVNSDRFATSSLIGVSVDIDRLIDPRARRRAASQGNRQQAGDVQIEASASQRKDPHVFPVAALNCNSAVVPAVAQDPKATFATVVGALQTPEAVAGFDNDFITYDASRPLSSRTYSPQETFAKKSGICRDHSRFQAYVLNQHGYHAWSLEYGGAQVDHSICVYQDLAGRWNAMEYGMRYKVSADSFESLGASLQDYLSKQWGYKINWMEMEMVTVDNRATILQTQSPEVGEILDRVGAKDLKY